MEVKQRKRERDQQSSLFLSTRRERKYLNHSGSQAGDQKGEPAFILFFNPLPHRGP